jgi:hypothetical protein
MEFRKSIASGDQFAQLLLAATWADGSNEEAL